MAVIEVEGLVRDYKVAPRNFHPMKVLFGRGYEIRRAVDGISFRVEKGELVGYVGPNGAGKSTTIKILTGILVPTAGCARVLGRFPHRHRVQNAARIGAVFGQRSQLWWDLRVRDSFDLLRRIYRLPTPRYRTRLDELSALLDLEPILGSLVRQISLGQRMRAELAAALLHEPEVLFLDEPTIGLDIVAKDGMRKFIRRMRDERGLTVVLTTHDMRDIEEICDRIVMIDRGRIVFDLPAAAVRTRFGGLRTLRVEFECEPAPLQIAGVAATREGERRWSYAFDRSALAVNDLIQRLAAHCPVRDLIVADPPLEDIMRGVYAASADRGRTDGSGEPAQG